MIDTHTHNHTQTHTHTQRKTDTPTHTDLPVGREGEALILYCRIVQSCVL